MNIYTPHNCAQPNFSLPNNNFSDFVAIFKLSPEGQVQYIQDCPIVDFVVWVSVWGKPISPSFLVRHPVSDMRHQQILPDRN